MQATIIGVHSVEAPEPCYLIEIEFNEPPDDDAWFAITQEIPDQPQGDWQVPWDEQPLDTEKKRWAFFFHYLDVARPLLTPCGPIVLPEPTERPQHLDSIAYESPC